MKQSLWRPVIAVSILVLTVVAFVHYFMTHPEVREQLARLSPGVTLLVLGLYLAGIIALAFVTLATLRLCRAQLGRKESLLLTAYSAIVNFFGPLQSGPAFRAVYLKKKLHLNLKDYALATLVYYFFYGGFSVLLLVSGILKWWLLPLAVSGLLLGYLLSRSRWLKPRLQGLDLHGWYYLALATLLQIIIVTAIYYTELRSVAPGTSLSQAIIYSGAANLALFVSLTPGAIGFRESFLVFSQHLHHISSTTIVTANIIDRALYLVLLLILVLFIFATHARKHLGFKEV